MDRIPRLREQLAARELPAALLLHARDIGYLTGFTGSTAALIVTPAHAVFVTDSRYVEQAREECPAVEIVATETGRSYEEKIGQVVRSLGLEAIAVESEYLTLQRHEKLQAELVGIALLPVAGLVAELRQIKDPHEIAAIRRACELTDRVFEQLLTWVKPGVRERDLAIEIEYAMKRQGAEREGFPIIVASGPRSALPHGRASERQIEVGDFVTFDFGAVVDGYCSDLTRTVVVGRASERQREIYAVVLRALEAAIAAIRAGVAGRDIDAVARERIAADGYGEYFGHGLGHQIGLEVHDGPGFSPRSEVTLAAGMVLTVEPGVYLPGWGGVRIEDDVLVTADGCEVLTRARRDLIELAA